MPMSTGGAGGPGGERAGADADAVATATVGPTVHAVATKQSGKDASSTASE